MEGYGEPPFSKWKSGTHLWESKHQAKYTYLVMETYDLLCLGKGGMNK